MSQNLDTSLPLSSELARKKALALESICREMALAMEGGATVRAAAQEACTRNAGLVLEAGNGAAKELPLSEDGLVRHYYRWLNGGRSISALVPKKNSRASKLDGELLVELRRRCTLPGMANASVAIKTLVQDWKRGDFIPGLGTWRNWWLAHRKDFPLPAAAPDFPVSKRTLYNYLPSPAAKEWGTKGLSAARPLLPFISRDYGSLRPSELFIFDDVRLDVLAIDDLTRKPTEMVCYISIEGGCRLIPAFIMRPANAMLKTDVDLLVVRTLKMCGIGRGYQTHLYFERGTLTMSDVAAEVLEKVSEGRIKVHFTSMNSGRSFVGAHRDEGKGHWMGKAVLESFMRSLHLSLMFLPGQRGNNYSNQPESLGWVGQGQLPKPGTMAREAETLSDIQLAFSDRIKLNFGLCWVSEVRTALRSALKLHNTSREHQYQGFSSITETETAPGVWKDVVA
ncbi:MAG: hypothetical protein HY343_00645 [Lentisphaerae bacterium]|nr:hypothetical protein [Lentisphaerota bacterium]